MSSRTKTISSQPSWRLANTDVEAYVTVNGGQLGPVTFDRKKRRIRPYHVAPWANEPSDPALPMMLRALRGDFFCMPFGDNATSYRGERHPPHGETANRTWTFRQSGRRKGRTHLHVSLNTRRRQGRVDKHVMLIEGHQAVYCRHIISQMSGNMSFGHHAMLQFPEAPGSGIISTSPFKFGQVVAPPLEAPSNRGYSILKPGGNIRSLAKVPMIDGRSTDLRSYPARRGFEDLVQLFSDPSTNVAWTAAAFPKEGYVWIALKDPQVLTGTILWLSNGGRHYPPWNGRHVNVMGIEEVTSYFHFGLAESVKKNPFNKNGYRTAFRFKANRPLTVNTIMAVAPIPRRFNRVRRVEFKTGGLRLVADRSIAITVPLDVTFLHGGVMEH